MRLRKSMCCFAAACFVASVLSFNVPNASADSGACGSFLLLLCWGTCPPGTTCDWWIRNPGGLSCSCW